MHDVVVVGGGPAGAAAAIACVQAGLDVVVLERQARAVEKPGETLHPGVEPLLDRLGVGEQVRAAGFLRHAGVETAWGGPPRMETYGADAGGPWRGFQAWRSQFDQLLLDVVATGGGAVRRGVRVRRIVPRDECRSVLETDDEAIETRWVVDAAGGTHWLSRTLGLPIERFTPRLICWYGYVRGETGEPPRLHGDESGWTWLAEVRPHLYQWTRLSFDGSPPVRAPITGEVIRGRRAADVTWRWIPSCAGLGYVLVGDAAAVLDPTSSHGVLRALMTGMKAGHLVATAARERRLAGPACRDYRAWLAEWVRRDVIEMRSLYRRLPRPPSWADSTSNVSSGRGRTT